VTKPASEGALGELHSKVAKVMTKALDQIERQQENWENYTPKDDEELPPDPPEVNPALLSVMVRFLDANKITCAPETGNEMSDLEKRLEAKRQRKRVGNVVHLHDTDE
jgi:hypothetical protein